MPTEQKDKKMTAMQMMIEFMEGYEDGMPTEFFIIEAKKLLEVEKKQIIDTVDDCWTINDKKGYVPSGEQYYSNKYTKQ